MLLIVSTASFASLQVTTDTLIWQLHVPDRKIYEMILDFLTGETRYCFNEEADYTKQTFYVSIFH